MKKFQLFRYLKKWLPLIVIFFLAMTALSYRVLANRQTYTASSVIEYSNKDAKDGYAPNGAKIDVSEISSSAGMAKVMQNLGLSYENYSLDTLCAGVSVEPVIEEQAENIQAAMNEGGEEYTVHPTAYIVRFTMDSKGSQSLARDILNELLDVYFSDYSKQYINQEQIHNQTRNLADTDYDYLEMVENIDAQLTGTVDSLHMRYMRAENFRSVATGYSFSDLRDQFSLLQHVDISRLYSLILGNQISKDKALLLDKYQNRIANYRLDEKKAQEDTEDILNIIDSYVDKMRESGNTDIDYNYILDDVYDRKWLSDSDGNHVQTNRTVQYDTLLRSWIKSQNKEDYALLDREYCNYVIGVYRDGITELDTAGTEDEQPVFEIPEPDEAVTEEEVEREIRSVINRMNVLYGIVDQTNAEYNEYLGAKNIRILSSVSVSPAFSMKLYMGIVALFFLLVGCCGAILLGRVGDILEYLFLRDSATGCMNRVSCDNYIQKHEKHMLPLAMCCISLQITNQHELNELYGREETDRAFQKFGRILQDLFGSCKDSFIGYNGGGQFLVFFEKDEQGTLGQEVERLVILLSESLSDLPVAYQLGAVNVGEAVVFRLRNLISVAVSDRRPYMTTIQEVKTTKGNLGLNGTQQDTD